MCFSTCSLAIRGKSKKHQSIIYCLLPSLFSIVSRLPASCQIPYPVIHSQVLFLLHALCFITLCISFVFVNSIDLPNELMCVLSSLVSVTRELFEALICWSRCYCSIILYTNLLYCSDLEMLSRIFLESRVQSYQAAQNIQHAILWSLNVMLSSMCVSSINRCAVHYLTACRSISFRSFFSWRIFVYHISVFSGSCSNYRIYTASSFCLFDLMHGGFFAVFSSILLFLWFSLPFSQIFLPFSDSIGGEFMVISLLI